MSGDALSASGGLRASVRRVAPVLMVGVGAMFVLGVGYACPIHYVAGIPCPTCGITRACRLALHGDVAGATRMHPLVWVAVPVVTLLLGVELAGYARTGKWGAARRMRGGDALMATTAALLFVLWLARFAGYFGGPVH